MKDNPSTSELRTRLDGMDKAIALIQSRVDRMPTPDLVQADVNSLAILTGTRIDALQKLVDAEFQSNSKALDAALLTRKEATEEIKESFSKQFDSQNKLIDAIKERIDRAEGRVVGIGQGWGVLVSAMGIIGIIVTILLRT